MPGRAPNLISEGTALAALGRVPGWADDLWERVHRVEGRCVLASGVFVDRFGDALDALGLAEIARNGIELNQSIDDEACAALVRYHAAALFAHLGRAVAAMRAFVAAFDPALGAALAAREPALRRIEALAAEAERPRGLRIAAPERAAAEAARDPAAAVLTADGVGPPAAPRRWTPAAEYAAEVFAEGANALDALARAAVVRIDAGAAVELDLRREL